MSRQKESASATLLMLPSLLMEEPGHKNTNRLHSAGSETDVTSLPQDEVIDTFKKLQSLSGYCSCFMAPEETLKAFWIL